MVTVQVRDADDSPVSGFTYSLGDTRDGRYFRIDPTNGTVYVINRLDRETQQQYEVCSCGIFVLWYIRLVAHLSCGIFVLWYVRM